MKKALYIFVSMMIMAVLCSCGSSVYSGSDFSKAPTVIYTTTAEENGYGDAKMYVEGTVGEPFKELGKDVCEIVTQAGELALLSIPLLTSSSEWTKLKEGDWVRVNFQYLGYSDVLDKASGALISVRTAQSSPDSSGTDKNGTTVVGGTHIVDDKNVGNDEDTGIWASEFTPINDFYYTLDKSNHTITLNRFKGDQKKIMLSPVYTIDGADYTLISMGDSATFLGEISITSVYIPEGVKYISDNCFNSCSDLEYLYIPSTIESITDNFLSYLHDYEIYCDSFATLPAEQDTNDYEELIDDRDQAYELGESLGGAANGLISGILDGMSETSTTVNVYFGGTESQWNSVRK